MKVYQKPIVQVFDFAKADVITTSGIITGELTPADYTASTQWKSEWDQLSDMGV